MSDIVARNLAWHNANDADLRRLRAVNAQLLEALQRAKNSLVAFKFVPGERNAWEDHDEANLEAVNAAIATGSAS